MDDYKGQGMILSARNIIDAHNFGVEELKILVRISKEAKGKFFETKFGLDCCRRVITKDNFERIGLTLAKFAALGYDKYFSIVLADVESEDEVYNALNQLPVKVEKTETYTVQGLNALGFMCCHVTNSVGGFGTISKEFYTDPFKNINTDINNMVDYNPFASIIKENINAHLIGGSEGTGIKGSIGVIYDYGYIYESYTENKLGREIVDRKSGIQRRKLYGLSIPPILVATGSLQANNVILLRKWTVSGIFYTSGVQNWVIERLKKLSDEFSFKEYVNGAYWYRTTPKGIPARVIKVFPVYEIELQTNKSKIVHMPQNPNCEVRLDKPNNNTRIAVPLGQSQFSGQVEGDYFPYEFYSKLHHVSTGTDVGMTQEGVFGQGGAGVLIVTQDLSDVMLLKRSQHVLDPNVWGIAGGARKQTDAGMEDAIVTAVAEAKEEIGGLPRGRIRKIAYTYKRPQTNFNYFTFILEIDPSEKDGYAPTLNYENTEWKWFRREELMDLNSKRLIHPGVVSVLERLSLL